MIIIDPKGLEKGTVAQSRTVESDLSVHESNGPYSAFGISVQNPRTGTSNVRHSCTAILV